MTTGKWIEFAREQEVINDFPQVWIKADKGKILERSNIQGENKIYKFNLPYDNDGKTTTEWIGLRSSLETTWYSIGGGGFG